MSRGPGRRQREILDQLAEHRALSHYTGRPAQWVTLRELAGLDPGDPYRARATEVESTRRALRGLQAAGLVELARIHPDGPGQTQLAARLV